jgi:two-component system KDP operon response regulator KdpE
MKKREAHLDRTLLTLTPTEFRVLACLEERAGEAVSQEDLVERAWGVYRQEGGSALRRYIWFLRKKIEDDPESPKRLVTVRGWTGSRPESASLKVRPPSAGAADHLIIAV